MQQKWIFGEADAVVGITDFEIVFRIQCRDIDSRDLTRFYEVELKNSKKTFPNTSSFHKQLQKCNILWVLDGFDESSAEFKELLKAILRDMPNNHKVIITTRPASSTQLLEVEGISEKQRCELTLEKFDENQIKEVARKHATDVEEFECYCEKLKDEDKKFLETPLNLNLVLQLWSEMNNVLFKDFSTNNLYKFLFDKRRKELVKRLKGRTHIDGKQLEFSVEKGKMVLWTL